MTKITPETANVILKIKSELEELKDLKQKFNSFKDVQFTLIESNLELNKNSNTALNIQAKINDETLKNFGIQFKIMQMLKNEVTFLYIALFLLVIGAGAYLVLRIVL